MTMNTATPLVEAQAFTVREALQGCMRPYVLAFLCLLLWSPAHAEERTTDKKNVTRWYEAFNTKDPRLLDRILSEHWVDIPAAPGQPPGRDGAKHLLVELTTTFPDLQVTIEEVLQDGHKVIVRSTITGTQRDTFMGFPAKHRKMTMQAVDIQEFHDGNIVRTWHTENWLTGLHQLGVFEQ
jgi:steroid delta-isomerase-like uncharacterized protein